MLDDFYVPGGGWWIDRVRASGFFLGDGDYTVDDVEVAIWPHDYGDPEPTGDEVIQLDVTGFNASTTGEQFADRDVIELTIDLSPAYLTGHRYYWVEIRARDHYNFGGFSFLGLRDVTHNTALVHVGGGSIFAPSKNGPDLAFTLFGDPIRVVGYTDIDSFVPRLSPPGADSMTLYVPDLGSSGGGVFDPGFYEIAVKRGRPQLTRIDADGRVAVDFFSKAGTGTAKQQRARIGDPGTRYPGPGTTHAHTPIGDWMCGKAPSLIQGMCQTFVACAAYELFCP